MSQLPSESASERAAVEAAFLIHQQGDLERAAQLYGDILAGNPGHFDALQLMGALRIHQQDYRDADRWLSRALALNPAATPVLMNHAMVLQALGRSDEALQRYGEVIALEPAHSGAFNGRGIVANTLGRVDDAMADFTQAIALDPRFAEAHFNLGTVFFKLGALERSIAGYEQAVALDPDYADALYNLGVTQISLGRPAEALRYLARVQELAPSYPNVAGYHAQARWQFCDWSDYASARKALVERVREGVSAAGPFLFLSVSDGAQDQLICARSYAATHLADLAASTPATPFPPSAAAADRGNTKIRIAYVSADFREHAVSYLTAGLIERHDRTRFEVIGIHLGPLTGDAMQQRMQRGFDRYLEARDMDDAAVVTMMRTLGIDIAVDLVGHTRGGRPGIFARRCAPVQVSYLGYPGTSGTAHLDYLVADRYVVPESLAAAYSEQLVRMPHAFQANDDQRRIAARPERAAFNLPAKGFVFCSFHSSHKITPEVFDIWMRLLDRVKGSVLWLFANASQTEANLRREAQARGISAERLIFARQIPYAEHLARYTLADLCLDTLPFNGGTTTSDALWAGLPLVTCSGEAFAARMSGSLLRAIGLPELIAQDLADYERIALRLAREPAALQELRERLARNRSTEPLFDTLRFTRTFENALVTMHERQLSGKAPTSFDVPDVLPLRSAGAEKTPSAAKPASWWSRWRA